MPMTSAQKSAALKSHYAWNLEVKLIELDFHLLRQETPPGIVNEAWRVREVHSFDANWRRKIFSSVNWWMIAQDHLVEIDGYSLGFTSAVAADRRRRLKPVTEALQQLMSTFVPAYSQCILCLAIG